MNRLLLLLIAVVLGTLGSLALASDETGANAIASTCPHAQFNSKFFYSAYGDIIVTVYASPQEGGDVNVANCGSTQPCKWEMRIDYIDIDTAAIGEICIESGPDVALDCYPGQTRCMPITTSTGHKNVFLSAPCSASCQYEIIGYDAVGGTEVVSFGDFDLTCDECQ